VPSWIAIAALVIAVLSLFFSLFVVGRVRRPRGRPLIDERTLGRGTESDSRRIDSLATQLEAVGGRLQTAESKGQRAIQRVGIVRYNPFEDTGSNQSFVLAILDGHGDGFVLSSLHSRQQTRVFLKQISSGTAETALSEEEAEAIRRAAVA